MSNNELDLDDINELLKLVDEAFAGEVIGMSRVKHPTTRMVSLNALESKLIALKQRIRKDG